MKISKMDRKNMGREWRINLVNDINNRAESRVCSFDSLPRDELYSLHIEYNLNGVKPHSAERLNYEELRTDISRKLVVPSNLLMRIFVAPYKEANVVGGAR